MLVHWVCLDHPVNCFFFRDIVLNCWSIFSLAVGSSSTCQFVHGHYLSHTTHRSAELYRFRFGMVCPFNDLLECGHWERERAGWRQNTVRSKVSKGIPHFTLTKVLFLSDTTYIYPCFLVMPSISPPNSCSQSLDSSLKVLICQLRLMSRLKSRLSRVVTVTSSVPFMSIE